MRRGYWTGFIMGGMLGMLAARAYGNRMLDRIFPGLLTDGGTDDGGDDNQSDEYRPTRIRRRFRRKF